MKPMLITQTGESLSHANNFKRLAALSHSIELTVDQTVAPTPFRYRFSILNNDLNKHIQKIQKRAFHPLILKQFKQNSTRGWLRRVHHRQMSSGYR